MSWASLAAPVSEAEARSMCNFYKEVQQRQYFDSEPIIGFV